VREKKWRTRRPGAGRKSIDSEGPAVVVPVRFPPRLLKRLNQLATKNRRDRSGEIRAAVGYWVRLLEKPKQHVGALTILIAILVRQIEAHTGRKWVDDPVTGAAVREFVGNLIGSLAPGAREPPVLSPELRAILQKLIWTTAQLYQEPNVVPVLAGDDWAALAVLAKDLGPAFVRNFSAVVTIKEVKKP
jgi:hypothetical protein